MLAETEPVSLRSDASEPPTARRAVPQEEWELPAENSPTPAKPPRPSRRRSRRWGLFVLLPIALIVGGYFYVEGGAYMSTDDVYIEADKVGPSTDVSGMIEAIEVRDNQHVTAGQVLFRLDHRRCISG
jgi:membrane fusion protein (multidrug efflux system)